MGATTSDPAKMRVVNACLRCRRQKVKFTGGCPCDNCKRRQVSCTFEGKDSKMLVTKKHLSELKRRTIELEKENNVLRVRLSGNTRGTELPLAPNPSSELSELGLVSDDHDARMVNPLSTGSPKYVRDMVGSPHYLGHTSNWSLTMRLLHLTHRSIHKCPFPTAAQHMDSTTYDLGLRTTVIPDISGLPSLDHSLFLINATKSHTGQMFHLFDEPTFMPQLYEFYQNPAEKIHSTGLWFIHFLVIISLGKGFVDTNTRSNVPPGASLFKRAFLMLPDYCYLWRHPSASAELLCSMALYFQCIYWRTSAHNMIGQALRILIVHGYHTDIPPETLGAQAIQRSRRIWWTAYILESVYGQGGRQVSAIFMKSTQKVLKSVADVASELTTYFPVPEEGSCIMLATRPFLYSLLEKRLECPNSTETPIPTPVKLLLQSCFESAKKTIDILRALQDQSLLGTNESFLPFDLESAVSAGLVILMATIVSSSLVESHYHLRDTVFGILDDMIDKGNFVAQDQKAELKTLETLLEQSQAPGTSVPPYPEGVEQQLSLSDQSIEVRESTGMNETAKATGLGLDGNDSEQTDIWNWAHDMTPTQLMELVDMLIRII